MANTTKNYIEASCWATITKFKSPGFCVILEHMVVFLNKSQFHFYNFKEKLQSSKNHSDKIVKKQGWPYTPADILMGI